MVAMHMGRLQRGISYMPCSRNLQSGRDFLFETCMNENSKICNHIHVAFVIKESGKLVADAGLLTTQLPNLKWKEEGNVSSSSVYR